MCLCTKAALLLSSVTMLVISYLYPTFSLFITISYAVSCLDMANFSKENLYHVSGSLLSWINRPDC